MRIEQVDIYKLNVELKHPTRVPIGVLDAAHNVAVRITTDGGVFGWGEASPFAPVTGDTQDTAFATAQQLAKLIKGKDALAIEKRMSEINGFTVGEPSIRAAFDIALYDILAKQAGLPLYRVLGGEARRLRTDLTIGMQDTVEETVGHARNILEQGFSAIKMKVGRPGLEDVEHIRAVRELAGPAVTIKLDSNQGWDLQTAIANIRAIEPLDVQYSEQPLAAWDIDGLARLRTAVDLPICADESVFDHHDAMKLVKAGAVDYLNIKLGKSGGIHTGLKINAVAEAAGCKCMIGCFAESRLALSAAAHLAAARPNIAFLDLDSAYIFKSDPVIGGLTYDESVGGLIHLPETPGHGAAFDGDCLDQASRVTV